jgi:molybdate transport system substrate-binding protein
MYAHAGSALVAVAANFAAPAKSLVTQFSASSGHQLRLSIGSTGSLYTQIMHGAPYDVFMSADDIRPRKLVVAGVGIAEQRFTYAVGRLALVATLTAPSARLPAASTRIAASNDALALALRGEVAGRSRRRIATANPQLAPYGRAAEQTLQALGLASELKSRLVRGENVGQALALVATGNAALGFIAHSQVLADERAGAPKLHAPYLLVPMHLHAPIRQDVVLLRRSANNQAALEFMVFLRSAAARALMASFGYERAS